MGQKGTLRSICHKVFSHLVPQSFSLMLSETVLWMWEQFNMGECVCFTWSWTVPWRYVPLSRIAKQSIVKINWDNWGQCDSAWGAEGVSSFWTIITMIVWFLYSLIITIWFRVLVTVLLRFRRIASGNHWLLLEFKVSQLPSCLYCL